MASTKKMNCSLINIQSVGNKTNIIHSLITDQDLDICMLTETWLRNNISDNSKINEMTPITHNFYHVPRINKSGGGVGLLIKKLYKTKIVSNQSFDSFEHINLKILYNNKSIQTIIIYRPPNMSKREFLKDFGDLLNTLNDSRNILICGDFNLHLDNKSDNYVSEFNELLESHDLENTIDETTSLSGHIIDLVIQTKNNRLVNEIIIEPECTISPVHKVIHFSLDIRKSCNITKKITYRKKTNYNAEKFIEKSVLEIREKRENNNSFCESCRSLQSCVNCFTRSSKTIMANNYDNICPEETKEIIVRENAKWYNSELREAKKNKRKMEDKWKRSKKSMKSEYWNLFKVARNKYNNLIEKTKREYFSKLFGKKENQKKCHENLNNLLGMKKEKILPTITGNYVDMANNFANHFEEKIERIITTLDSETVSNNTEVIQINNSEFSKFSELTIEDFIKIIGKLRNTYSENDPFPISDVKDAKNLSQIYEIYYDIVCMSMKQSIFPKSEKIAYIKPSYKGKGDKENLNSYRPISNLSFLSKVIETVVYKQTWNYVKQHKIIPEEQSAYRENHSTETTVCAIVNDMNEIIVNGKCGIMIMLDLSAAFDTVDHKLLLESLLAIGIKEEVHKWFENYLEDRSTAVVFLNEKSQIKKLKRGVPQGSVLGPLLFGIYTIELSRILDKHGVMYKLYADDTQFYFQFETIEEAKNKIDAIMSDIKLWMTLKKLKLNEDKTECMLFGSTHTLKKYDHLENITIGLSIINIKKVVRDLGVQVDSTLSMKNQVLQTVKMCNFNIRNIAFIRKYLNEDALKTAICNYVLSRLDYCNSLYKGLPNYLLKKLQNTQNRAARLIKGLRIRERITPSLIELHWLPIKARIEYKILFLVFKALKYGEPTYLRKHLSRVRLETNVTIRHTSDIHRLFEPRTDSKLGERSFRYSAPRLYNNLPSDLKNIEDEKNFKKKLKTYLFTRSYDLEDQTINSDYKPG